MVVPATGAMSPTTEERPGPSTAAVMTTELVSGLRTVTRHLSRPSASEGHLRTELTISARHIESLIRTNHAEEQPWAIAASSLIHDAAAALEQRRVPDGWELLRAARTEIIDGMDRRDLAVELADLTGSDIVLDEDIDIEGLRAKVWAIREKRNTYDSELERRMFAAARSLAHRAWMLFGVIALGAVGVLVASPSSNTSDALGSMSAYLTIVGLAVTGAAVSHVFFTRNSTRALAISDIVNPLHIVMLRLMFGGVVGLLLVVLLQADVQNLLNVTGLAAYPWAIVGGFSERYVDRIIDRAEADAATAADEACRAGTS